MTKQTPSNFDHFLMKLLLQPPNGVEMALTYAYAVLITLLYCGSNTDFVSSNLASLSSQVYLTMCWLVFLFPAVGATITIVFALYFDSVNGACLRDIKHVTMSVSKIYDEELGKFLVRMVILTGWLGLSFGICALLAKSQTSFFPLIGLFGLIMCQMRSIALLTLSEEGEMFGQRKKTALMTEESEQYWATAFFTISQIL